MKFGVKAIMLVEAVEVASRTKKGGSSSSSRTCGSSSSSGQSSSSSRGKGRGLVDTKFDFTFCTFDRPTCAAVTL